MSDPLGLVAAVAVVVAVGLVVWEVMAAAAERQRVRDALRTLDDVLEVTVGGDTDPVDRAPAGPVGMTANAVCSLSLDPLLALVCFANGSRTLRVVRERRRFGMPSPGQPMRTQGDGGVGKERACFLCACPLRC